MKEKTIVAISTPLGKGAISIIRMSGKDSLKIARQNFTCKDFSVVKPRYLYLGLFKIGQNLFEKCFCVYFKAPYSYTGEDMIEFQVHGGSLITQKVMSTLLNSGAALAEPGEFSRRAFENGKLSLDEAESIANEINAESESELKASLSVQEGKLKKKVRQLQNSLTEKIAEIETSLDYPEEDIEQSTINKIKDYIKIFKQDVKTLLLAADNAKYIQKGINIAIIGAPNVGKSSILNALVGCERAIVTEIAGTTRDTVEESAFYNGIKLNFIDTAGIRNSNDKVEKIGIEKSKKVQENADIVLVVLDGSKKLDAQDKEILNLVKDKDHIIIVNKIDRPRKLEHQTNEITVSALKEQNIEKIKQIIYQKVIKEEIDYSGMIITNERQIALLNESLNIIKEIDYSQSMDIIAMQIKKLWNCLGKITGECENEEIIDMIFTKFCLGK